MAIFLTLIGIFCLKTKMIKIIIKKSFIKENFIEFIDKLSFKNGDSFFIGKLLNDKNDMPFPYLSVICVDKNFKKIKTEIEGIGSEFHSDFKLIRVIKKDKGNWRVGFMEKTTGKLVIKFRYHNVIPYLTNDHFTYSRVHRLGSTTPEYINENGKKIKNFYPELYIRNNIKAPQI